MSKKKQTIVALDKEQIEWLESKIEEGYSKSGLIRYAVKRLMKEPSIKNDVEEKEIKSEDTQKSNESESSEPVKKVEIDKILEIMVKTLESGELDKYKLPKDILGTAKSMQERYKNLDIDHLNPQTAFILGKFKGEVETQFNQVLQKWAKEKRA